tara:strand:- start:269 stop:664 length:396 start_codon:yes stop_codon:yes gene_type:complete
MPDLNLPSFVIPTPPDLPRMTLKVPTAYVPRYKPIVVPPSDLERPEGVQAEATETVQPDIPKLNIPVLDIEMPIPEPAVVVTAVTTAVVAVATTSVTQTLFEPIKKRVQKFIQGKVDAWKKKRKEKVSSVS